MSYKDQFDVEPSINDFFNQMRTSSTPDGDVICELCNDMGYSLNEKGEAILCKCTKNRMLHNRYAEAGIPKPFFDKAMSDWNTAQDAFGGDLGPLRTKKIKVGTFMEKYINVIPALAAGMQLTLTYKKRPSIKTNSLLLTGGLMSGKTFLASVIIMEAIKKGFTGKLYDWLELSSILSDYNNKEQQDDIAEQFENRDIIVIDGIANYPNNSYSFLFQLDRLSTIRISSAKPIILTCHHDYAQIRTGPRWKSLLAYCYELELPTPNPPAGSKLSRG